MNRAKIARRIVLGAFAASLLTAPAFAAAKPRVAIETDKGTIVVELEDKKAPVTAGNFLYYVDKHRFDGGQFFRANRAKGAPGAGSIQGQPKPYSRRAPPIAHESTLKTGLKHTDGTISMGRHAPGTAQADWFICLGRQAYLDADATQPGFAAFGHVTEGLEVVKQILTAPVDPTKGTGSMQGEMLRDPVPITTVRRV